MKLTPNAKAFEKVSAEQFKKPSAAGALELAAIAERLNDADRRSLRKEAAEVMKKQAHHDLKSPNPLVKASAEQRLILLKEFLPGVGMGGGTKVNIETGVESPMENGWGR